MLRRRRPLERTIERAFVRACRRRGWWALKLTILGLRGFPDRIVLARGPWVAFAELKRPGRKLEPLQRRRATFLRRLGFPVAKVDREEQIEPCLRRWARLRAAKLPPDCLP